MADSTSNPIDPNWQNALNGFTTGYMNGTGLIGAGIGLISGWNQSNNANNQYAQMQNMLNANYNSLLSTINNDYSQAVGNVGQAFSAADRYNQSRESQMLGAAGLAGSPMAAAEQGQFINNAALNAGQQYTQLGLAKGSALTSAQEQYNSENLQLLLTGQQAQNQITNGQISNMSQGGSTLGTLLTSTSGAGGLGSLFGGSSNNSGSSVNSLSTVPSGTTQGAGNTATAQLMNLLQSGMSPGGNTASTANNQNNGSVGP